MQMKLHIKSVIPAHEPIVIPTKVGIYINGSPRSRG